MSECKKVISLIIAASLALLSIQTAKGQSGQGRMSMNGSIVIAPCTIETEDMRQVIDIGAMPVHDLIKNKSSDELPFSIRLRNCIIADNTSLLPQNMQIRFQGRNDGEHFGVSGTARGVSLVIKDAQGKKIVPGIIQESVLDGSPEFDLHYTVALVGNGEAMQAGEYQSSIEVQIAYF